MKRHNLIFLAMLAGVLIGLGLGAVRSRAEAAGTPPGAFYTYAVWWLDLLGPTLFVGALNMLVAPLIFASIFSGVTSLPNLREVGAVGWKIMAFYLTTTALAVALGLVLVQLIQPGKSAGSRQLRAVKEAEQQEVRVEYEQQTGRSALDEQGRPRTDYLSMLLAKRGAEAAQDPEKLRILAAGAERTPGKVIRDDLIKPLLSNPFQALAERNTLGIISFSILLGIAAVVVGAPARPLVSTIQGFDAAMLTLTQGIMALAPLPVAALMASFVAQNDPKALFESLAWYCVTILGGLALFTLLLLVVGAVLGGVGPIRMMRGLSEACLVGFSSRSSGATLPVSIACVINNLGVSPRVANFTMPLGTINQNGTALYEGVAVTFLIQMFSGLDDVPLTVTAINTLLIFVTAVLAAIGAAAVPSSGLITMAMVATAVNLPTYYIGIILIVDPFLDMFRTVVNIIGDAVGTVIVDRMESKRLAA